MAKKETKGTFYGEQPIEVANNHCLICSTMSLKNRVKEQLASFIWSGNNHLKQIMYNPENGASYDGLMTNILI
jgi:hypothetical protein